MADEILSGLRGIKTELRAVQDQMAGLDAGSQEFVKLSQKAGELRDRMRDVQEAVNANAGPAIASFGNNLSIARGQIMDLDLEGFGESMTRMASNVKSVDFKSFKDGLKSMTDGFGNLAKALLSNPIFLIAGAIALIAMNMDKVFKIFPSFEKGLKGIGEQEREIAKAVEARAQASKKAYEQSSLEINQMKLAGKSEREIVEFRMARLKTSIADAKVQLETSVIQAKMQIETAKRNREILDGIIQWITSPLQVLLGTIDLIGKAVGKDFGLREGMNDLIGDLMIDPVQIETDLNNSIIAQQDALKQMESDYVGFQLNIKEIDKKAADTKKQNENEERAKSQHDDLESIKSRDITRIESANLQKELKTAITNHILSEEERQTIAERKAANERKEIWAAAWYAKYELASATTDAMMNLNNALTESGLISAEKGFKIGKGLSIAQTTIATIQGVQNALSAMSTIPEPFGTALKIANAVSIGAAGAVNIAKIAKTQFNSPNAGVTPTAPSGGGGGGGGGAMSAPSAQSPSALNLSFLQGNVNTAPLQTYVLAGQVSNAQQAEFKIKNTASILGGG
jgi:hypothetical protein